ncbi:unnamed protein product [Sphagnum troendelagicum]|uniref:Uncharacterized protein n=1 Tax=Sphagnum troendelagicum TaxID=128251 RepID=A0ABP0URJ7_9BRYO
MTFNLTIRVRSIFYPPPGITFELQMLPSLCEIGVSRSIFGLMGFSISASRRNTRTMVFDQPRRVRSLQTLMEEIVQDFDWEAAVAEIDKACDKSQQSKATNKYCQKTLDAFLKLSQPRPLLQESIHIDCGEGGKRKESVADLDPSAFTTWVYPANIPCRQYQLSITKTALFTNTIVALPTGLGKTLIAAVVMYNYFRWFPTGKIVFTAPSRPLVVQQIEACHNVMGIPQEFTIDMTGQMSPPQRAEHWQSLRIFFVTPQVLEKDIQSGICPMKEIVCLVVDEAHRATGNYSYCVVIRELLAANVQLRILALTATPGSKQATIQAVLDNLQISCLEYRDENDLDVRQYTHHRELELIQVPMNAESNKIKDTFVEILIPLIAKLCDLGVFYTRDLARISPYELIMARDKFRQAPPDSLHQGQYREVECGFGGAITLCHILKLLHSHGIRPALEMLLTKLHQGSLRQLGKNNRLQKVKDMMQESVGHGAPSPKLVKMEEIILSHFSQHNPLETRVIIFTNFRESVKDILETLNKIQHVVKATEFIGQTSGKSSKGQTQKMQQAVLQKFRAGGYNTIVATSIAEEGLDIMEVDLVICFDANVSPIRMIQRMGRTGRKRDGRTQGYQKKQAKNKTLIKYMQHGGVNTFTFHPSPRMVPHAYKPEVQMLQMSIKNFVPRGRKLRTETASGLDPGADEPTEEEHELLKKYAQPPGEMPWKPSLIAFPSFQLLPTPIYTVKHSVRTVSMLIDVLQGLQEPAFHSTSKVIPFSSSEKPESEGNVGDEMLGFSASQPLASLSGTPSLIRSHRFLFHTEIVYMNAAGRLVIASPPKWLPLVEVLTSSCIHQEGTKPPPSATAYHVTFVAETPNPHGRLNSSPLPCIASRFTPFPSPILETPVVSKRQHMSLASPKHMSPLLFSSPSPEQLVTPAVLKKSPQCLANLMTFGATGVEGSLENCNAVKNGYLPGSSAVPETGPFKSKSLETLDTGSSGRTIARSMGGSQITNPQLLPDLPDGEQKLSILSQQQRQPNVSHVSQCQLQGHGTSGEMGEPESSKHGMEDSNEISNDEGGVESTGVLASMPRPQRRFKRLKKACKLMIPTPPSEPQNDKQNLWCSGGQEHARVQKTTMNFGKDQRKLAVRSFIEEEAEVSSDEDISTDEDDSVEANGSLEGFIDPSHSQHLQSGSVDMMAIYRRSLLTQSPMEQWQRFLPAQSNTPSGSIPGTTVSSGTGGSDSKQTIELNSASRPSNCPTPSFAGVGVSSHLVSSGQHTSLCDENRANIANIGGVASVTDTASVQQVEKKTRRKKLGLRKRKLSFQLPVEEDDDDVFAGVDLDALEQEAVLQARTRATQLDSMPSFDLGIDS